VTDFDLVVRGQVVLSDGILNSGYVAVSGGQIAAAGEGASARESHDLRGQWIVPGVVDGQVHTGSQGGHSGKWKWPPWTASRSFARLA
jgi:allantoinase